MKPKTPIFLINLQRWFTRQLLVFGFIAAPKIKLFEPDYDLVVENEFSHYMMGIETTLIFWAKLLSSHFHLISIHS